MSYTIHHTTGIILGMRDRGEANRVYVILTRDLGVIHAIAQSSRKETSKMRYGLQLFDHSNIDCVYGNDFWRLTGIEPVASGVDLIAPGSLFVMWRNIARLLERLIPFDEAHPELFETIIDAYQLARKEHLNDTKVRSLEKVLLVRILYHLGYWQEDVEGTLLHDPLSTKVLEKSQQELTSLAAAINASLRATQL